MAAHVDGQLDAEEMQKVSQHLSFCVTCAYEFAEAQRFQHLFAAHRPLQTMPTAVEERLRAALLRELPQPPSPWQRLRARFPVITRPVVGLSVTAVAAVIFVVVAYPFLRHDEQSLLATVAEQYRIVAEDRRSFTYVMRDPRKLEQAFNDSGQLDFTTHVLDLRRTGYRIRGGNIIHLNGRPTAVTVYRSVEGDLLCLRQRGMLPPLPPGAERVGRDYVYSYGQHTVVFVQEHGLFCILVSGLPRELFLRTFR
jgi:anti-sigma factor RsiW